MSAASPQLIWDGFTAQHQGMNDGISRFRLPPTQAALLLNATTRGDFVRQRPGWDRIMTVLPSGLGFFQHFSWFKNDAGRVFLIVVAGGRFFRIDPIELSVLEITIPGDPNPFTLTRGWSVQAGPFWIYNDGQTKPFIWTGGSARRAGQGELLPGTVLAYVQSRIWYSMPDGRSFRAGDLAGNRDSGTPAFNYRDSVLRETENTYLNEGGNFPVPSEAGEIVAMRAPTILDTSQGQGPLLVVCENDAFSVNTPVDRKIWKDVNYPIQTVSLMGRGGYAQGNCINVAGDIWFRSRVNGEADGISSYIIARREFLALGNVPQSFEVSNAIAYDQQDLLVYGSAGVYDNRLLMTMSPGFSGVGTYHRGLVALDLSPKNSIQAKAPPSYDGIWTGLNILAICPTSLGIYAIVLAGNGNFDLWKLSKNKTTDNNGPITWSHIPRALFQEVKPDGTPGRTLKRLEACEYEYDELRGVVNFKTSWAPDSQQCLTEWHRWDECQPMCETLPPTPAPPTPTGACCIGSECSIMTQAACVAAGGTYQGDGSSCTPNPCAAPPTPTGACCIDGVCSVTTEAECVAAGGTYQGDDTTCDPNPCEVPPATGACCIDGVCSVLTEAACIAAGGTYQGDDTSCDPDPCAAPPAFGCCQEVGFYFQPAYDPGTDRVFAGYIGASSPGDNLLRVLSVECDGISELAGTNVTGGGLYVASNGQVYFGVKDHGAGTDEMVLSLNPSTLAQTYIGGFTTSAGLQGKNSIWVPATSRIWTIMNAFAGDNIAIINPVDNSYVMLADALLVGVSDFCYCSSNQCVYAVTGSKLVKIDVNTLAVTNVALAGIFSLTTYCIDYVSSADRLWLGMKDTAAGPPYSGILSIDPATALFVVVEQDFVAVERPNVIWYSSDFDRVLAQFTGVTHVEVWDPAAYTVTFIPLAQLSNKGVYVSSVDKVLLPTVVGGQWCLTYFDRATIIPP